MYTAVCACRPQWGKLMQASVWCLPHLSQALVSAISLVLSVACGSALIPSSLAMTPGSLNGVIRLAAMDTYCADPTLHLLLCRDAMHLHVPVSILHNALMALKLFEACAVKEPRLLLNGLVHPGDLSQLHWEQQQQCHHQHRRGGQHSLPVHVAEHTTVRLLFFPLTRWAVLHSLRMSISRWCTLCVLHT